MRRRKLPLPTVPHLQILILDILFSTEQVSGEEIRNELDAYGEKREGPAFYQLMARMEKSGLIQGQYKAFKWNKRVYREAFYSITDDGRKAYQTTWKFYANLSVNKGV